MGVSSKDWYWEAEHDRIAADESLRLVRSPEGWPSGGLECVGLWFLVMNQLWRSPRIGYLCDLTDTSLPMSDTELAALVGRDSAVVKLILKVLLVRKMFSVTPEGIIYSRGILRKLEIKKKRISAGRKGGKASQRLLKQTVEQNTEQRLGIGIGIGIGSKTLTGSEIAPDGADPLTLLADEAALEEGWGTDLKRSMLWRTHLGDLQAAGFSLEQLTSELEKKPRKSEPPWDFFARLMAQIGKPVKHGNDRKDSPASYRHPDDLKALREASG